jgi:hypothetical protein
MWRRKGGIMTRRERIKIAISTDDGDPEQDTMGALLRVAYYMGRESQAKEAGDKIAAHLAAQHERAEGCRYWRMAKTVVGEAKIIYLPDYAGDYAGEFGGDLTSR